MADPKEIEEAPRLTGPIISRPRGQYISSMFSRNLLTRQRSMRKPAYRPRYAPDTTTTTTPLTPPDTPPYTTTTRADKAEDEDERRTSSSRRPWWRPRRPSSPSSSPRDMLLDETTLDRPSIRLYRPDPVPDAVVAAAAAASATATGGLEAKDWKLVLVVSIFWCSLSPSLFARRPSVVLLIPLIPAILTGGCFPIHPIHRTHFAS